jgi:hypothetical protein
MKSPVSSGGEQLNRPKVLAFVPALFLILPATRINRSGPRMPLTDCCTSLKDCWENLTGIRMPLPATPPPHIEACTSRPATNPPQKDLPAC